MDAEFRIMLQKYRNTLPNGTRSRAYNSIKDDYESRDHYGKIQLKLDVLKTLNDQEQANDNGQGSTESETNCGSEDNVQS